VSGQAADAARIWATTMSDLAAKIHIRQLVILISHEALFE